MQIVYTDAQCLKITSKQFWRELHKNCNKISDIGYTFEVDVDYTKYLHDSDNDLPFLPKRVNIKKCQKLVCNLHNKGKYFMLIRTLKKALSHGLILKKRWKNNNIQSPNEQFSFGKTMENVRKYRDIRLVTTDKKRSYLVSEPKYHGANWFTENFL